MDKTKHCSGSVGTVRSRGDGPAMLSHRRGCPEHDLFAGNVLSAGFL